MPPAPAKPDQMPTARARCSGGKLEVITDRVTGMIMAAEALLRRTPKPTEQEIRDALAGNLCRCTGYVKIVESVQAAAEGA